MPPPISSECYPFLKYIKAKNNEIVNNIIRPLTSSR